MRSPWQGSGSCRRLSTPYCEVIGRLSLVRALDSCCDTLCCRLGTASPYLAHALAIRPAQHLQGPSASC